MAKHKAGLHKKISSIFDGVPVPKEGHSQPQPAKGMPAYVPPVPRVVPAPTPAQPPRPVQVPPPKAGGVAVLPTPPQQAPRPAPQQAPRTEPAVAPIKHYKLDADQPAETPGFFSNIQARIKQKLFTPKDGVKPIRQIAAAVSIPILCVVLVVLLTNAFKSPSSGTPVEPPQGSTQVTQAAVGLAAWKKPGPFPENPRDPMKRTSSHYAAGAGDLDEINLSGITVSEDRRTVSIAGKILREGDEVRVNKGDSVKLYRLISISRDEVEYESEGIRYIQKVGRELQPKTPTTSN